MWYAKCVYLLICLPQSVPRPAESCRLNNRTGYNPKSFLYILSVCVFVFCLFSLLLQYEILDIVIAIVIGLFIRFSSTKNTKYYTSFWVECIPILWWLILVFVV